MKNWRTTTAGILGFLTVLLSAVSAVIDGNPATVPDWASLGAATIMAVGLWKAKDAASEPPK